MDAIRLELQEECLLLFRQTDCSKSSNCAMSKFVTKMCDKYL